MKACAILVIYVAMTIMIVVVIAARVGTILAKPAVFLLAALRRARPGIAARRSEALAAHLAHLLATTGGYASAPQHKGHDFRARAGADKGSGPIRAPAVFWYNSGTRAIHSENESRYTLLPNSIHVTSILDRPCPLGKRGSCRGGA